MESQVSLVVFGETPVLEPCVLVLRNTQQKYHGIVGVAVDDIAGGGDEVWEQAISKLKQRFTLDTGKWERENSAVVRWCRQQMDPCVLDSLLTSRAWTLCPFTAIRSVLGALGYVARESRPDLSGPVSARPRYLTYKGQIKWSGWPRLKQILHCPYAKFLWIKSALCLMEMPVVVGTPVLVSLRSHRVKRVVTSASAAEAMVLSEAIAQGDWVRALWSEVVLGLKSA